MANDPGLSNDSCIFMEAIPGDGGNQNAHDVWWLSPDIRLVGPVSGPDIADAGQINPVQVKFHRKAGNSGCLFPGDESITVELWVANPSLVMSPRAGETTRVGIIGSPVPDEGGTGTQQIDWDVPSSLPPDNNESPGPKCLVARCYPDSGVSSNLDFFVPGDHHVAQRNLCVGATTTNGLTFKVNTLNPSPAVTLPMNQQVKVRAVQDLQPSKFVSSTVTRRLQHGFTKLRATALPFGFKFDLTGLQSSQVVDHSHPGLLNPFPPNTNPSFEAQIVLATHNKTQLTFEANLKGAATGEACIFHLTQTSVSGVAQGGLTLVALKL
jgi:hypothetical protein